MSFSLHSAVMWFLLQNVVVGRVQMLLAFPALESQVRLTFGLDPNAKTPDGLKVEYSAGPGRLSVQVHHYQGQNFLFCFHSMNAEVRACGRWRVPLRLKRCFLSPSFF